MVTDEGELRAFSERLAGRRRTAGLTQRQLAAAARVSVGVVRELEQGLTTRPRPESVRRLARALGQRWPAGPVLRLNILGSVTAWRDGRRLDLGAARCQAILGLLAASPLETLRPAQISDVLWGAAPPEHAATMIQSYVSSLRRALDPGRPAQARDGLISWTAVGYRLDAGACELDLIRFRELAAAARSACAAGDQRAGGRAWSQALSLWRGDPLGDVDLLAGHPVVRDLARQRDRAIADYAETALQLGDYGGALPHLEQLTEREPFNERAAASCMIALAGTGQHAAAMAVFDSARRRLGDELGLLPGPELQAAHARVLQQQVPPAAAARLARSAPVRVLRGPAAPPRSSRSARSAAPGA
jgi:DNA-binding SARP family transcriptional activator